MFKNGVFYEYFKVFIVDGFVIMVLELERFV